LQLAERERKIRGMAEKLREYTPAVHDGIELIPNPANEGHFLTLVDPNFKSKKVISEEDITKFCNGCDYFEGHSIPCILGPNNQARYAARKLCGYARINGQYTTKEG